MIATIAGLMDSHNSKKAFKKGSEKSQSGLLLVYVAFLSVAAYVYHVIAGQAFSNVENTLGNLVFSWIFGFTF